MKRHRTRTRTAPAPAPHRHPRRDRQLGPSGKRTQQEPFAHALGKTKFGTKSRLENPIWGKIGFGKTPSIEKMSWKNSFLESRFWKTVLGKPFLETFLWGIAFWKTVFWKTVF